MSTFLAGLAGGAIGALLTLSVVAVVIFLTLRHTLRRIVR